MWNNNNNNFIYPYSIRSYSTGRRRHRRIIVQIEDKRRNAREEDQWTNGQINLDKLPVKFN